MTASHACATCGHQNRLGAKFCQKCGAHLAAPAASARSPSRGARPAQPSAVSSVTPTDVVYCGACKREVAPDMLFCRHCGTARQATGAPTVIPIDPKSGGAPVGAGPNMYMPTLPLPARSPAPAAVKPAALLTGKAKATGPAPIGPPAPTHASAEIAKTLMLKGTPLTPPVAAPGADYQLAPRQPVRTAWPGWFWFLLGLLMGVLLTVAVFHYGTGLIEFFG